MHSISLSMTEKDKTEIREHRDQCTCMHVCTHACARMQTHAHECARPHTHAQMHACTSIHTKYTHKHTHRRMNSMIPGVRFTYATRPSNKHQSYTCQHLYMYVHKNTFNHINCDKHISYAGTWYSGYGFDKSRLNKDYAFNVCWLSSFVFQ